MARLSDFKDVERRGRYALFKELGRGGFAVVRLAADLETDQIFDPKYSSLQDIRGEIDTLRYLGKHSNIVSLHDVLFLKNETIMLMDLVQGGELFDYIVDSGSISEKDASRMLQEACQALEYIHSLGVCHRDLKPENLLLTDQSPDADIKIADFGLSRRMRKGETVLERHPSGTIAYWAPEIIRHQPQDFGVDMWAFGVLTYITLTGVHPFDPRGDRSDAEIIVEVAKGKYDVDNEWYKSLSNDAKDFLARLLESDPRKRMSATQALKHPWLQGKNTCEEPLAEGHAQRIASYRRLQNLRANILAVIVGVQHAKFEQAESAPVDKQAQRTTTVNLEMFQEAFALFDKDSSGDIDRQELEGVMTALGQRLSPKEIDAIMKQADTDGDGKISFVEFVSLMNHRLYRRGELTQNDLRAAFKIFDSNQDGFISSSELEYMMHLLGNTTISTQEIERIIQAADCNGDGKIDFEEFCGLMQVVKKAN
ncbi:TPA: hypothetical protein N0F65_002008 [Lagenidium giganteum]|uniref:Calmodulin n=1 Tax=Lagenidium giganteum TaxID=4803 RepID=A0AAV2Z5M0_9STRA|nr:TPA: hypothetical protein N0F65_002008 [Lagenidium giganteum]